MLLVRERFFVEISFTSQNIANQNELQTQNIANSWQMHFTSWNITNQFNKSKYYGEKNHHQLPEAVTGRICDKKMFLKFP